VAMIEPFASSMMTELAPAQPSWISWFGPNASPCGLQPVAVGM
jgi:hypothetical protein